MSPQGLSCIKDKVSAATYAMRTIFLRVVDTVTDDENVRYREADKINLNGHFSAAPLANQRAGQNARCLPAPEDAAHKAPPGINDIIHEQNGPARQIKLGQGGGRGPSSPVRSGSSSAA
jgi:hypothetical protein